MNGYWDSPELIYVGNTKVTRGWQTLLDGYEELSKTSGGQIGTLELEETQITVLSKDSALVWGTYRVLQPGQDRKGLYTLVLRRFQAGWRTIYDRTSSEPLRWQRGGDKDDHVMAFETLLTEKPSSHCASVRSGEPC